MGLGVLAANALALNQADDIAHYALHQNDSGRYRVADNKQLAGLLRVNLYELGELQRCHQVIKESDEDHFDADDVLWLLRYRRAILSETELDKVFGAQGTAQLLYGNQLIECFAPRVAGEARFAPDSVVKLLKSIRNEAQKLPIPNVERASGTPRTCQVVFQNVLGLLNKTALAASWPAPFRLIDLEVTHGNFPRLWPPQ